jgi:hypothetical protein
MIKNISLLLLFGYAISLNAQTIYIKNESDERVKITITGSKLMTSSKRSERLGRGETKTLSIAPGKEEHVHIDVMSKITSPDLKDSYTKKKPLDLSFMYARYIGVYKNAKDQEIRYTITPDMTLQRGISPKKGA